MTNSNFINYHVLVSASPSCLNRDDMNMQKTAIFGGATRIRISSQSLKRAMRTSDYYTSALGMRSIRTRQLPKLKEYLVDALEDRFEKGTIEQAIELLIRDDKKKETDKGTSGEGKDAGDKKVAVAPWAVEEVAHVCELIDSDGNDRKKLERQIKSNPIPFYTAMAGSVDIALSGRMATSGLMRDLPVDGALAVAHAITTHGVDPSDIDWFTAVDDLTQGVGDDIGAGHLDTQEFSAGVFYRFASLNLKQLQVNLGLLAKIQDGETLESRARALEIAKHVFHMMATVLPMAKQQTFAAFNLADFAIVSFADMPISLANAFERPVARDQGGGYLEPSCKELSEYFKSMNEAYGLDEHSKTFSIRAGRYPAALSLKDMESWIESGGRE